MIRELEREQERRERAQERPSVRIPLERPEIPQEEADSADTERGVSVLDISPMPSLDNVTIL